MAFERSNVDSSLPPTRSRSLISKFTNRFSNRNRNISDFHIEPDDPWKTYSPGNVVKGSVILTVTKPLRITHLVVCLHGYAKVFKNSVAPGEQAEESGYLGPGRGRRGGEYLGNGFASLFEDEVVLCGDGRLKEGVYKFGFELCFPPYRLPSSIQFERGAISYVITSTLTRPTTISPTLSCDKRIVLLEPIDIFPIPAPKPKVMSLEPISRRMKNRSSKSKSGDRMSNGANTPDVSPSCSDSRPPLSPVTSERSSSSCITDSSQSFQIVSDPSSRRFTASSPATETPIISAQPDGTITATTRILRAGVLPGDVLPIHISIRHSKPVRSPNGIILTLYRQGRVDSHPAIPIGVSSKGKKPIYEDYYPKSRTGLGGLTFSGTSSCSLFRKDLSQSFSPLIVDPHTMKAELKTSVRIPEDCFPTITHVPGGMISFRYYVEVVMDLGGKLASHNHFLPRLGAVNSASKYCPNGQLVSAINKGRGMVATDFTGNVIDTDQVRREKGVVACVFEVIVGTTDSGRGGRQQQQQREAPSMETQTILNQHPQQSDGDGYFDQSHDQPPDFEDASPNIHSQYGHYYLGEGSGAADTPSGSYAPQFVPPIQPDENVDEKTRLRKAEEMLFPSEPPAENVATGSSAPLAPAPSAPRLSEEDPSPYRSVPYNTGPPNSCDNTPVPSATSVDTLSATTTFLDTFSLQHPSPAYSGSAGMSTAEDDKQDLERQRLLNQTSAPPVDEQIERHGPSSSNHVRPSAPALTEEDIVAQVPAPGEALPRYQR